MAVHLATSASAASRAPPVWPRQAVCQRSPQGCRQALQGLQRGSRRGCLLRCSALGFQTRASSSSSCACVFHGRSGRTYIRDRSGNGPSGRSNTACNHPPCARPNPQKEAHQDPARPPAGSTPPHWSCHLNQVVEVQCEQVARAAGPHQRERTVLALATKSPDPQWCCLSPRLLGRPQPHPLVQPVACLGGTGPPPGLFHHTSSGATPRSRSRPVPSARVHTSGLWPQATQPHTARV
mmetsp:Transcript_64091/g.177838  ORF Transcript_64091/g.177838 Transcript_64091/m.177838 type:complete len:237 (+) Transcript_64091:644-1354(+)